jgi:hypothetical protein
VEANKGTGPDRDPAEALRLVSPPLARNGADRMSWEMLVVALAALAFVIVWDWILPRVAIRG